MELNQFDTNDQCNDNDSKINNNLNESISLDVCNEDVYDKTFDYFNLDSKLLEIIGFLGFIRPSPIQYKALPLGLESKDLIVQSKSGTGKTLLFILIILSKIHLNGISVIIAPTRELVVQIYQEVIKFTSLLDQNIRPLYSTCGKSLKKDRKAILKGCRIVVSTPGRLMALVSSIQSINVLVLDEVDMLLDDQFHDQISFLISEFDEFNQIIATSATLLPQFANRLINLLPDRQLLSISTCLPFVLHTKSDNESPVLRGIKFCFIKLSQHEHDKFKSLLHVLESISFNQAIIFCNRFTDANIAFSNLSNLGYYCNYTSSKINHTSRMRCLRNLRNNNCKIFICSDLLSRGIDSLLVDLVINLDVPFDKQTFLHRCGRAARYGKRGICICIANHDEWLSLDYYRMSLKLNLYPFSELAIKKSSFIQSSKLRLYINGFKSYTTDGSLNEIGDFNGMVELSASPFITIYDINDNVLISFIAENIKWIFNDLLNLEFNCQVIKLNSTSINKVVVSVPIIKSTLLVKLLFDKMMSNCNDFEGNFKLYGKIFTIDNHTILHNNKVIKSDNEAIKSDNDKIYDDSSLGYYGTCDIRYGSRNELYYKFMSLHLTRRLFQMIN